jgi:transcriptional regulator with XRE-family HTH domain
VSSIPLPNHLRFNRKRLGISQDEVAFLLGAVSGAKICRYEHFILEPNLKTALAFEAIFRRPVRDLFPGLYSVTEVEVKRRAKMLCRRLDNGDPGAHNFHKREAISKIAGHGLPTSTFSTHDD